LRSFCKTWKISHNPVSPYMPRSNGQVERSIGTIKKTLKKAMESGEDIYTVLLDYRTTPVLGEKSPAELLMGRRIRAHLPVLSQNLKPEYSIEMATKILQDRQEAQHQYADLGTKELTKLRVDQKVLYQDGRLWLPATIKQVGPQPRSYIICTEKKKILRRNRVHLRPFRGPQQLRKRNLVEDYDDLLVENQGQLNRQLRQVPIAPNLSGQVPIVPNPGQVPVVQNHPIPIPIPMALNLPGPRMPMIPAGHAVPNPPVRIPPMQQLVPQPRYSRSGRLLLQTQRYVPG